MLKAEERLMFTWAAAKKYSYYKGSQELLTVFFFSGYTDDAGKCEVQRSPGFCQKEGNALL